MSLVKSSQSPWKFIFEILTSVRLIVLLSFGIVIVATLTGRVKMFLTEKITNAAVAAGTDRSHFEDLWYFVLLYVVIHFLNGIFWRGSGFAGMQWITKTKANIHQYLFNHLTRHSVRYFGNRFAGSLANKISNVATGFETIASETMWNFAPLFVGLAADLFLTFHTHYSLALVLLVWMFVFLSVNVCFGLWLKKYYYRNANAGSKLKGKIIDSTGNINTVQTAPGVAFEQRYVSRYVKYSWQRHLRSWFLAEWVLSVNVLLISLFVLLMLGVSVYLYQQNLISIGSIVLIIAIVVAMERSLFFLGNSVTLVLQNYGQIEEGLDDLLIPYEVADIKDAPALQVSEARIKFEQVDFFYDHQQVFKNLNIEIHPGEKLGLVGLSGAGKSTFVSLLMRQYDPQAGQICIDGQNIAEVSMDSLRAQIAYVPQSTELFHRTIYENIRYGSFSASVEQVKLAAEQAYAAEFIESFPQKYHTFVGERGVKLSGGQRQRIAIARSFLKKSQILILDEATSALDSESEGVIQRALEKLMAGKTVIAIAHRLSTLQIMDRIIVLDQGQILESGSHQELLAKQGFYARMWEKQVSGFIQDE